MGRSSGKPRSQHERRTPRRPRQPSLLTGLVVDAEGEGLTPSHPVKNGRRYRYYVSRHLVTEGKQAGRSGWRLPAADLETLVMARLREWLGTAAAVSALLEAAPQDVSAYATLITNAKRLAARWPRLAPASVLLLARVDYRERYPLHRIEHWR